MTANDQLVPARIVCELDPSTRAEERVRDAIAACEEHGAELHVVWVMRAPAAGASFALPAVLATAIDLARERGISATSAVRYGKHEVVLRREEAPVVHTSAQSPPLAA
jgi:hypothetical protein